MRRLTLLLAVAVSCRSVPVGPPSGAESPKAAVDRFLAAAQAQDIQAMSAVWGDESGPTREKIGRQELERRELIMVCLLTHDQARVAEAQRSEGGRLVMQVELRQGPLTATSSFTVAKGPSARWYVQDFETIPLQNKGFCQKAAGPGR